jgi:putative membrane-bound dehydrogenase-like protein
MNTAKTRRALSLRKDSDGLRFGILRVLGVFAVFFLAWTNLSVLQKLHAQQPKDSIDKDYAGELPRIAPTEPKDALKTLQVAKGFKVEQVAAEPLVASPVAIAFDENARLYVVEMRGYSESKDEKVSQIRLLEDANGDGVFDKSTVFKGGLAWPTAVFCWAGGVLVVDAPDFFYFKDTNGDGKADEERKLYTGLGVSNVQGLANSFQWGLDNRIYLSLSSTGAELRKVDEKDERPLALRGRDIAIDPRTWQVTPVSGGAQHGMSFDDWGNRFVCSNSDHLQEIMYEDRYLGRNPYLAAPSPRRSIAADGPQADVFRTSPVEPWRIVRTRLRATGVVPGVVEGGGRAAGYFTGATGATIYRGDAWPKEWQGIAVVGDVGSNLVHRKRLEPDGVGFVGRRIDEKSEFVSSSDIWFRPCQYANVPDGSLYILDMYREVIEHPASLPAVIKKHLDLTSGRDRGRLYRVVPEGFKQPALPKLEGAGVEVLVALLQHPNGWHRDTAARLLYERQDKVAIPLVEKLAIESALPLAKLHAMYVLAGADALSEKVLLPRLRDEHAGVREHAVKLAEKIAKDSAAVRAAMLAAADDGELRVRYQAAFSLGELPESAERNGALLKLAKRDLADGYVRLAVLSSLAEGAGEVLKQLAGDSQVVDSKEGREMLASLAAQIGRQQRSADVKETLVALKVLAEANSPALPTIIQRLGAKSGTPLAEQIAKATGGKAETLMKSLLAAAAKRAADEAAPVKSRVAAVEQLRLASFGDQRELLSALLSPAVAAELQGAALGALASFDAAEVAEVVIGRFAGLSPRLKGQATDLLLSRPAWTLSLLSGLESGQLSTGDLDPVKLKLLAEHRNAAIRERAQKLLVNSKIGRRSDVVEAYRGVLEAKGDAARGKLVFTKTCAACHKVQAVGNDIGPNLAAMKARGPEAILLNVLDPNREVNPQYLNYAVLTADGRQLTGLIAAETATSITLKRADNATDTVLRIDIEQLKSTGMSLMPEGMEKQIDQAAMADLLEFLRSAE